MDTGAEEALLLQELNLADAEEAEEVRDLVIHQQLNLHNQAQEHQILVMAVAQVIMDPVVAEEMLEDQVDLLVVVEQEKMYLLQ